MNPSLVNGICNVEPDPVFELSPHFSMGLFDGRRGKLRWLTPGVEYTPLRAEGPLTLYDCFVDYTKEHCLPTGGDPGRAWIAFRSWINALGDNRECVTLTRADGRTVVDYELNRKVTSATARKHLTMGLAALNHARKEERLGKDKVLPAFQMPAASQPRIRWLTREEHRKLMLLPKSRARQLFWLLAFGTGARTGAILDLEWSRVDLVRRTIDYRREGVVYKNKRRAVVFINDSLLPRLEAAYARRDESCPFVVNRKGKRYSQGSLYHECKRDLAWIGIKERGVARHVARHTVATWMLRGDKERGIPPAPIHRVALMLGDTITMIERTYSHVLPTDLQDDTRVLH